MKAGSLKSMVSRFSSIPSTSFMESTVRANRRQGVVRFLLRVREEILWCSRRSGAIFSLARERRIDADWASLRFIGRPRG